MKPYTLPCVLACGLLTTGLFAQLKTPDQASLDLALQAPAINTAPLPQYADENRDFALTTGIEETEGGRLWSAWFAGGDSRDGFLLLASSDDRGNTWSPPRQVIDPSDSPTFKRRTLVGNIWKDPQGRLWLFFDQSIGYFDGRAGVWAMVCENPDVDSPVWSQPTRIGDGATLNKPTVLSTGEWVLPVSLWRTDKIWDEKPGDMRNMFPELDDQRQAWVYVSRDQGATWQREGGVKFPRPDFDEHMIVELKNGSLWMTGRTVAGIEESFSTDGGKHWTPPRKTAIASPGARHFIRRLNSGNLLLVKNGRRIDTFNGRKELAAFLSRDDGRTWEGGLLLDDGNKGVSDVTYPDGFQAKDGTIFIQYDFSRYGAAEIRMARFTEADILAGNFQSPGAKSQILVNKAKGGKPQTQMPAVAQGTFLYIGGGNNVFMSEAANWAGGVAPQNLEHAFVIGAIPAEKQAKVGVNVKGNIASMWFGEDSRSMSVFGTQSQNFLAFAAKGIVTPVRNNSAHPQTFSLQLRQYWIGGPNPGRRIWDAANGDILVSSTTILRGDSAGGSEKTWELKGDKNITFSGGISAGGFAKGNAQVRIEKNGKGTLALQGDSSALEGDFDVQAGTLRIANTAGSATGKGTLTIHLGATLAGTGSVGGPAMIGGVLAPDAGESFGQIAFGGSVQLMGTLKLRIDPAIKDGVNADRVAVSGGGMILGGKLQVIPVISPSGTFKRGQVFKLIDFQGAAPTGSFSNMELPELPAGMSWKNQLAVDGTLVISK